MTTWFLKLHKGSSVIFSTRPIVFYLRLVRGCYFIEWYEIQLSLTSDWHSSKREKNFPLIPFCISYHSVLSCITRTIWYHCVFHTVLSILFCIIPYQSHLASLCISYHSISYHTTLYYHVSLVPFGIC